MSRYKDAVGASEWTNDYSVNQKPRRIWLGDKTLSTLLAVLLEGNRFDFMRTRQNFGGVRCTSRTNGTEQTTGITPQYFLKLGYAITDDVPLESI